MFSRRPNTAQPVKEETTQAEPLELTAEQMLPDPSIDLKTVKHERFAQGVAGGMTQFDAFRHAGYKTEGSNPLYCKHSAWVIANRPDVKARIEWLRRRFDENMQKAITDRAVEVSLKIPVTRSWVLDELVENVKSAKLHKKFSDVNRGLELLGKELDMFVNKSEVRTGDLEHMTSEELEAKATELKAKYDAEAAEAEAVLSDPQPAVLPADPVMEARLDPESFEDTSVSSSLQ